jgi:hypothetical protein
MKKLIFPLLAVFLLFSCTKEEGIEDLSKSEGSDLSLYSMDVDGSGSGTSGGDGSGQDQGGEIEPGQITAGEWSDLENWDFWLNLMNEQEFENMHTYWDYSVDERISVLVENSEGQALVNQVAELYDAKGNLLWIGRSDNHGKIELWPGMAEFRESENYTLKVANESFPGMQEFSQGVNELTIDGAAFSGTKKIDIAFMVDATGSMADELEYLKAELVDVIGSVEKANSQLELRLGSVFYRDEGDEYVSRKSDFSNDPEETINFIKKQSANGGGDFPEAVHTALDKSINDLNWNQDAYSKILFVLLDAPPHYEAQIVDQIHSLCRKASAQGIRIIPVSASGIDKETEFLLRYMSIVTNSTYVFITGDSGIGGEHLVASVGDYEVEYLNELMVRLITEFSE